MSTYRAAGQPKIIKNRKYVPLSYCSENQPCLCLGMKSSVVVLTGGEFCLQIFSFQRILNRRETEGKHKNINKRNLILSSSLSQLHNVFCLSHLCLKLKHSVRFCLLVRGMYDL